MLNDYCHALGIDRASADFYQPVGILVEQDRSYWGRPVEIPAHLLGGNVRITSE